MIAKLKGIIDTIGAQHVILDVQGVGYLVHCSQKTLNRLSAVGSSATLCIETIVREDSLMLYGFHDTTEKECFALVTSVQGVGMKVALAILSVLSPDQLYQAIHHGDKGLVTQAEGVGPKLAARLVNELKDKIAKLPINTVVESFQTKNAGPNKDRDDAIAALVSLGYKRHEVVSALSVLDTSGLSSQELIRAGLAHLSRKNT